MAHINFQDGRKLPDGSLEKSGEELMISNVNRHDAGVYRCTANNGYTNPAQKVPHNYSLFD